jgi:membrane fusion protein (multidrug efflux system)
MRWHGGMAAGVGLVGLVAAVVGLLGLVAIAGCSPAGAEPSKKVAAAPQPVPVTVAPLQRQTVERTVEAVGSLRGWEQVTVGSKRTGRVLKVCHDMGDLVRPGEPLVELERLDAQLAYDQAQSKYLAELVKLGIGEKEADRFVAEYGISEELVRGERVEEAIDRVPAVVQMRVAKERALQNLNRQIALSKKRASTAQELEDYENEYRTAVAAYDNAKATARNIIATALANRVARDLARQALADMTIRVPTPLMKPPAQSEQEAIVYAVTKRSVAEGQMIREGEAVFELVIDHPLRLWCNIPERYADQIRVGQEVRIEAAAHPGTAFLGKVARINPAVDQLSRTFQVETLVPNERRLLRPGGFAKVTIVTETEADAAVVPIESVIRFAGVTKIFIVEDGKAHSINDIVTGREGRGWIEVSSKSLPPTALVVTTGQSQLADQTPVVIRTPEAVSDAPKANLSETP